MNFKVGRGLADHECHARALVQAEGLERGVRRAVPRLVLRHQHVLERVHRSRLLWSHGRSGFGRPHDNQQPR